jgi:hypothetical protein
LAARRHAIAIIDLALISLRRTRLFTRHTRRCEWSNRNFDPSTRRIWLQVGSSAHQRRCVMNKLVTAVALATLIASPALAQSFDPHLGSGNIVRPTSGAAGHLMRQQVPAGIYGAFASSRPVLRRSRTESALLARAKRTPQLY